jgi:hypothetical protein
LLGEYVPLVFSAVEQALSLALTPSEITDELQQQIRETIPLYQAARKTLEQLADKEK